MNEKKSILFVEDDVVQRNLLCRLTQKEGYDVKEAHSGGELLSMLEHGALPNVVVLDMCLPDINGLDVLMHIREQFNPYELPVVVLSGVSDTEDIVKALDLGANDYLTKPLEFAKIIARIRVCLSMAHATEKLMERERNRVMEQSLGAACHHVAQPITALQTELEIYLKEVPRHMWSHRQKITRILNWAKESSDVVHRLQNTHTYKTVSYFGNMQIVDIPEHSGQPAIS
jgi:DNA-binding response OmpR family regulator